jgi:hypothetical protein
MIKKYYILVLTFLCLFLGQVSYGITNNEGDDDEFQIYRDAGATVTICESLADYVEYVNSDSNPSNNIEDSNNNGQFDTTEIASGIFGFEVIETIEFAGEPAFVLANGDIHLLYTGNLETVVIIGSKTYITIPDPIVPDPTDPGDTTDPDPCEDDCECYGIGCPEDSPQMQTWYLDYDGDGYHSETYEAVASPGDKWITGTRGVDCDDTRPQYTTACCIKTCGSGYKLNIDTCECVLLPPCWGTTVEGLMPDGSGDQSQLVKALETMVNSFFKSSDLLETMKTIGILDPAELSKGFDNYLDGGDILGKISIGFVAIDYNNNPTTENFMKIFVEGALLFLPPPASVGYTALDTLYQKYFDGKPFSEILAKKMTEKSAELFDCDLGSGVYGLIH